MRASERDHHYGWHRQARPLFAAGVHRPRPGRWSAIRTPLGVSLASLLTIASVGLYLTSLRPNGQLLPHLPGTVDQVPAVQDSAIERLQPADPPPAASRSRPRTPTPAPALSLAPAVPRSAGESSSPVAAVTPTPDGGTAAQGPMPMGTTPCPPPLPPKPAKSKKAKAPKVTVKLFILEPSPAPSE